MNCSIVVRALPVLLALALPAALVAPGCAPKPFICPDGYTIYLCTFSIEKPNECGGPWTQVTKPTCATNEASALSQIDDYYGKEQYLYNLTCMDTMHPVYPWMAEVPYIMTQTMPSCVGGAGGGAVCTCGNGGAVGVGGSFGAGGSFGDGVGGSSDVGGVGAVGSAVGSSSADVGAGPSGAGGFGELKGRGGAGGAW